MSSFLMNSPPAAYASADPKFPPSEEYSQGNYIPDYYVTSQATQSQPHHPAAVSVHHHQTPHHYGYHHPLSASIYPSALSQESPGSSGLSATSYHGHHGHSALHGHLSTPQYYNPCTGSVGVVHSSGHTGHHLGIATNNQQQTHPAHQSLGQPPAPQNHVGSGGPPGQPRVSSPASSNSLPLPLHRSPSPRSAALGSLVEPPSPPDCVGSGSDSGQGPNPVIYPWMKKVHVNQGKDKFEGHTIGGERNKLS